MQQRRRWIAASVRTLLGLLLITCAAFADVPNAPTNLIAEPSGINGFSGVALQWNGNNDIVSGFNIYMSIDGGNNYNLVGQTGDSSGESVYRYWTRPLENGYYVFYVTAFNDDGESAQSNLATITLQGVGIRFTNSYWDMDSTIVGTLVTRLFHAETSDQSPVIYSIENAEPGMSIDQATGVFSWTPEQVGYYRIEIVATHANAPGIQVRAGYTIHVNPRPAELCATISGTIRYADGSPVNSGYASATVFNNGVLGTQYTATVSNGSFEIDVPEGSAVVQVYGGDIEREFYKDAATYEQAEILELACNQPVEITMTVDHKQPVYHTVIGGMLVDTAGNQLYGRILAYRLGDNGEPAVTAETWARNGHYMLGRLTPGEYVIRGEASDSVHVPGYHVDGEIAAMTWTDATRITVGPQDSVFNVEILLVYIEGHGGQARLRGNVVSEGGAIRRSDDPRILSTTPVEGATVYAVAPDNSVAGYAFTDAQGEFLVVNLEPGSYTILVDRVGLKPLWSAATVINGETKIDLTMEEATSSAPTTGSSIAAPRLFPNPIDRAATLRFNSTAGAAHVTLCDLRGETLLTQSVSTIDGENSLRIETGNLPAGTYLLRLVSRAGTTSIIVTIAH